MMKLDTGGQIATSLICLGVLGIYSFGCSTPAAYGPSGDERLATAVEGGESDQAAESNAQYLAELQRLSCRDLSEPLTQLETPPDIEAIPQEEDEGEEDSLNVEEEHLTNLMGILEELRRRQKGMAEILSDRPDLSFYSRAAGDGREYDVPSLTRECNLLVEQAELTLEGFIRELLSMPIISEVEQVGRRFRTIPRERVDLDLLDSAVEVLATYDADRLRGQVQAAKARLEEEKAEAQRPQRRRRR